MKMDGLDSAKCQKSRRRDTLGIYKIVNEERQKMNSVHLLQKSTKWAELGSRLDLRCRGWIFIFLERKRAHSL